jgi:hypothetical protein
MIQAAYTKKALVLRGSSGGLSIARGISTLTALGAAEAGSL